MPITQIYWSSTPYSDLGSPTNPWNEMNPSHSTSSWEKVGLPIPRTFCDCKTRPILYWYPSCNKGDSLGIQHQGIPSLNKNKYRQAIIPHWQDQSCSLHHNTSEVLPESTSQPSKKRKAVGPTTSPVLVHIVPIALDTNPPMGFRYRSSDKQHFIHNSNSRAMVRCLQI